MNPEQLDIYKGSSKKFEILPQNYEIFSFKARVTVLDKNIGAGCKVCFYEKATATLKLIVETDSNSFITAHGLLKAVEYLVIAIDKNKVYSSVVFDITLDNNIDFKEDMTLSTFQKYLSDSSIAYINSLTKDFTKVEVDNVVLSVDNPCQTLDSLGAKLFKGSFYKIDDIFTGRPAIKVRSNTDGAYYTQGFPGNSAEAFTHEILFELLSYTTDSYIFDNSVFKLKIDTTTSRLQLIVGVNTAVSVAAVGLETLYNIVVTYDKTSLNLFLNGIKQCQIAVSFEEDFSKAFAYTLRNCNATLYHYRVYSYCKYNNDYIPDNSFKRIIKGSEYLSDVFYYKKMGDLVTTEFNSFLFKNTLISPQKNLVYEIAPITKHSNLTLRDDFIISFNFKAPKIHNNLLLLSNNISTEQSLFSTWSVHINALDLSLNTTHLDNYLVSHKIMPSELASVCLVKQGYFLYFYINSFLSDTYKVTSTFDNNDASSLYINLHEGSLFKDLKIIRSPSINNTLISQTLDELDLKVNEEDLENFCTLPNFFEVNLANMTSLNFRTLYSPSIKVSTDVSYFKRTSLQFTNNRIYSRTSMFYVKNEDFTISLIFAVKDTTVPLQTVFCLYDNSKTKVFKIGVVDGFISYFNNSTWTSLGVEVISLKFVSVVFQQRSNTFEFYVNGVRLNHIFNDFDIKDTPCFAEIGSYDSSEYFNGYLNLLEIYKRKALYSEDFDFPSYVDNSYKDSRIIMQTTPELPVYDSTNLLITMRS